MTTAEERRRWAAIARRTHELAATAAVEQAIAARPVPLSELEAAERCLAMLDEPDPMEVR